MSFHRNLRRPPFPVSALRIGVTGHRPNRLPQPSAELLARQVRRVLESLAGAAQQARSKEEAPVILRLLSSLAEGTDRIVARIAMELGFELEVPLPMEQAKYEEDFHERSSKEEFRALLAKAKTIYVLEVATADRSLAYLTAGEILLNQSDFLLAVWDGGPGAGLGGTADIVQRALAQDVPLIRIDAQRSHRISFNDSPEAVSAIANTVNRILVAKGESGKELSEYRRERWPKRHPVIAYLTLRLFGDHRLRLPPRPDIHRRVGEIEIPSLKPYFLWSDTLALYYGERSRSASLQLQSLATLAVIAALLNAFMATHPIASRLLSLTEIISTVWLLLGVARSRRGQWHRRWLRYRATAEQLRCVDLLAPLGLTSRPTRETEPSEGDRMGMAFVGRFVRAIERELGMLPAHVNAAFLADRLDRMTVLVKDQIEFHRNSARRYGKTETFFQRCGFLLFVFATALSAYDVLHAFSWLPEWFVHFVEAHAMLEPGLATATVLLPALGAAAAAIAAQGEYKRLEERSESMKHRLETIQTQLERKVPPTFSSLCTNAIAITEVLSSEVRDWAVLVAAKPPSLPV